MLNNLKIKYLLENILFIFYLKTLNKSCKNTPCTDFFRLK